MRRDDAQDVGSLQREISRIQSLLEEITERERTEQLVQNSVHDHAEDGSEGFENFKASVPATVRVLPESYRAAPSRLTSEQKAQAYSEQYIKKT